MIHYSKTYNILTGFSTEEDAIDFIKTLQEIATEYGHVRISDVLDAVGLGGCYGDNKLGWTFAQLKAAKVLKNGFTYDIHFPATDYNGVSKASICYREYTPKNAPGSQTPLDYC